MTDKIPSLSAAYVRIRGILLSVYKSVKRPSYEGVLSLPSLQALDVSCVRRDRLLFSNLNVSLGAGDLVYLSGPNGAGKTSLLRIMVGLIEPSEGEIRFDNESIQIQLQRRKLNQALVYIGHKSAISAHASAVENSRYWCEHQGLNVSEREIYRVLTILGLVGLEDVPCTQLSAGQNRRVALARLWFKQQAKFWVLDEPFTALDVKGIKLIEQKIEQFLQSGGAVLMTSHQPLQHISQWQDLALEYQI